jgi:hypothetical protein
VTTDSTHLPEGLSAKDAAIIVRTLDSKRVAPEGSRIRNAYADLFINRAGRGSLRCGVRRWSATTDAGVAQRERPLPVGPRVVS